MAQLGTYVKRAVNYMAEREPWSMTRTSFKYLASAATGALALYFLSPSENTGWKSVNVGGSRFMKEGNYVWQPQADKTSKIFIVRDNANPFRVENVAETDGNGKVVKTTKKIVVHGLEMKLEPATAEEKDHVLETVTKE